MHASLRRPLVISGWLLFAAGCGGQTNDNLGSSSTGDGGTSGRGGSSSVGGTASGAGGQVGCPAVGCVCVDGTAGTVQCSSSGVVTGCLCPGTGGAAGTGGAGETSGTSGAGGAQAEGCPPDEPSVGAACSVNPTQPCQYGTDLRLDCRDELMCSHGSWQLTSDGIAQCPTPLPGPGQQGCPADLSATGQACPTPNAVCDMGGGALCGCIGGGTWACVAVSAGCPAGVPDTGQPCSGSQQCLYGGCAIISDNASCADGVWTTSNLYLGCPISS